MKNDHKDVGDGLLSWSAFVTSLSVANINSLSPTSLELSPPKRTDMSAKRVVYPH